MIVLASISYCVTHRIVDGSSYVCGVIVSASALLSSDGGIDVSDLGLTMEDLDAPLPDKMFQVTTSGTESTSRIPNVQDDGCVWEEGLDTMDVTLSIPGLRGQPPAALSLDITKNTSTITAFGMAVWSCILRGVSIFLCNSWKRHDTSNFNTCEEEDFQ